MVFLLLFFGSGATALIYEVIWSKYLSQMFGSTIQAQTVVLAVFMGGLALGNHLFGRKRTVISRLCACMGCWKPRLGFTRSSLLISIRWPTASLSRRGRSCLIIRSRCSP